MKEYLTPFVSIVAWCLMPNHFHFIVFVQKEIIEFEQSGHPTQSRVTTKTRTINQSIGILLASYSRTLQKHEGFTGPLFQKRTKAKVLVDEIVIEPSYWNTTFGTQINFSQGKSYLETCIMYVHYNPVYSGLVKSPEEWEFSSARDYLGLRKGKLIDYSLLVKENLLLVDSRHPTHSRVTTNICIIGIGSNIEAETNIPKMLEILKTKVEVLQVSTFLITKPIGNIDQADFTNGAVKIKTDLNQKKLNKLLKAIEGEMGRDRTNPKFSPRCIDLDIVVWNNEIVDEDYFTRSFLKKSVNELIR
ncbi:MAG: 2-amino-4-hydroxy-6-hydroxymethyldihydropteridine diphosphokinase [Draconibacterium sp.]|nr:2-amino-4-hydroxy-6-hydroxymethyldihydropteridine diphosphokinase [Draconibacterium sp.]